MSLVRLIDKRLANNELDSFNNPTQPYTARPLLHYQPASTLASERLIVQYDRRYFIGFVAQPRSSNIPLITEAQAGALDALHFLGEKHSVQLDFQKGVCEQPSVLSCSERVFKCSQRRVRMSFIFASPEASNVFKVAD